MTTTKIPVNAATHRDEYEMSMTDRQYAAVEAVRIAGMQAGDNSHEGHDGMQYFTTYEKVSNSVSVRTGNGRFAIIVREDGSVYARSYGV
jgi:hypothetical protein